MGDDYYVILGAERKASKEELKKSYHSLLLEYHPDKAQNEECFVRFCKIDKAWKTLSNDVLRREYDAMLKASEVESSQPINEEIKIWDMELNEGYYMKNCRCGGIYIVNQEDIKHDEFMIECDNCSLNLLVHAFSDGQNNEKKVVKSNSWNLHQW